MVAVTRGAKPKRAAASVRESSRSYDNMARTRGRIARQSGSRRRSKRVSITPISRSFPCPWSSRCRSRSGGRRPVRSRRG